MKELTKEEAAVWQACGGYISASEVARKAISLIETSLKQGIAHSRKTLEQAAVNLKDELKQCHLNHEGPIHINSNVRMFDLVRYMRSELHKAELITDKEYFWLCAEAELATSPEGGSPSRQRLEDYDELQAKLTKLKLTPTP